MRTNREFEEGEIHEDPAGIPKFGEKMHEDGIRSSFRAFFYAESHGKMRNDGENGSEIPPFGGFFRRIFGKTDSPPFFSEKNRVK